MNHIATLHFLLNDRSVLRRPVEITALNRLWLGVLHMMGVGHLLKPNSSEKSDSAFSWK